MSSLLNTSPYSLGYKDHNELNHIVANLILSYIYIYILMGVYVNFSSVYVINPLYICLL